MAIFPGGDQFIKRIIFHPCSRPWFVYVLTAIPCAIKLVATVTFLDIEDIMREHAKDFAQGARIGGPRGGKHGLRSILKDDAGPRHHWSQKAVGTMIRATVPFEMIGFTMLLIGAADQFYYDWQALLTAYRYCEGDPNSGPFQREKIGGGVFVGALQLPILVQNRSGWNSTVASCDLPAGRYSIILSLKLGYGGTTPGEWYANIRALISGVIINFPGPKVPVAKASTFDVMVHADIFFPFGGSVTWELLGSGVPVGLTMEAGNVMIMSDYFLGGSRDG